MNNAPFWHETHLNIGINSSPSHRVEFSKEHQRSRHHRNVFQNLLLYFSQGGHMGKVSWIRIFLSKWSRFQIRKLLFDTECIQRRELNPWIWWSQNAHGGLMWDTLAFGKIVVPHSTYKCHSDVFKFNPTGLKCAQKILHKIIF